MYKGHANRREYLKWCAKEWDRNHSVHTNAGAQSINTWAHDWSKTGAMGTFDVFSQTPPGDEKQTLLVFGYLLPTTIEDLANAFSEGLIQLREEGYVSYRDAPIECPSETKAPTGNTGLTSPPSAN